MGILSLKNKSSLSTLAHPSAADLGSMIPLATTTVGAGGASTITFSNIPQSYEHLQIRGIGRSTYTAYNLNLFVEFNSDASGSYNFHYMAGDGTSTYTSYDSRTALWTSSVIPGTYYADAWGATIIDILDYTNTNKFKTVKTLGGFDNNGGGWSMLWSGLWRNTSAISSIKLSLSTGNFPQHSSYALYGIKRAGA